MPIHPKFRHTSAEAAREHSVPGFWPFMAMAEFCQAGLEVFKHNLQFAEEALKIDHGLHPEWSSPNTVIYRLDTPTLRDFSPVPSAGAIPTLIDRLMPATPPPSPTTRRARASCRCCGRPGYSAWPCWTGTAPPMR